MKAGFLFLFISAFCIINAQKIDRNHLYGTWKMKGVLLRNEIVSFWKADTLIKKLIDKRKFEQPGVEVPKGDSIAIVMGAKFLCDVLYNLEIQISWSNEMTFHFAAGKEGSQDERMHVL